MKKKHMRSMLALLATVAAAAAMAQTSPQRLQVSSYKVTGNTLLQAAQIDAALAAFTGQRTLDELKQAAAAVQELYRAAGYGAVIAYLPEQTVSGGVATIAVLEGKVARVVVIGNQQFSAENVRRSLPLLQEGQTPRIAALDEQIQLANENPARSIAVTLEPGARQGEVDARVNVTEKPVSRWAVAIDNTGNSQTGEVRASLSWRHAALWDADHQASLLFQTSPSKPSQVKIFTAGYSVPFYGAGMRLDAYAAYSNVDGGSTPIGTSTMQFAGKGHVLGARLNTLLPRLGEVDQRVSVGLDRRAYLNECSITGQGPGACGSAGESVTVNPLSLEYTVQRGGSFPLGANLSFSANLDLGGSHSEPADFTRVRAGAPQRYTLWRLGLFANPELGSDWKLQARLQAQVSPDALVPGEQFGLAGANAVRGYAEREVIGDSGTAATVEVLGPDVMAGAAAPGAAAQSLRLAAFVDGGQVSNKLGLECRAGRTRCTLNAVGLGLRWSSGPGQLRVDVARAGSDGTRTDSGSWKLHLAGSWAFE